MDTITLKNLRPEDFDKVSAALKQYQDAKDALTVAENNLKQLGVVVGGKRGAGRPAGSGLPYTGKKRGRKPKNAQPEA